MNSLAASLLDRQLSSLIFVSAFFDSSCFLLLFVIISSLDFNFTLSTNKHNKTYQLRYFPFSLLIGHPLRHYLARCPRLLQQPWSPPLLLLLLLLPRRGVVACCSFPLLHPPPLPLLLRCRRGCVGVSVLLGGSLVAVVANKIFNSKYDYIRIYKKYDKYQFFEISCKTHGIFEKKNQNHIKKQQGCPLCSKPSKLTKQMFIDKSINTHGIKYDYSQVEYSNNRIKVKILCREHGIFEQSPNNHIKGQGCPTCSNRNKVTNTIFIVKANKIHGDKYDYTNINYINSQTNINFLCTEHGIFQQTPQNHLKGNQCYKCSNIVKTTDDFIKKSGGVHQNIYNYSKTCYVSAREKVIIICKTHGEFLQTPNDHLNGCGCNKCGMGNYSKSSISWLENIMKTENIFIQHAGNMGEKFVFLHNRKIKFDGYCEKTNTVYEFYGDFWHGNTKLYNPEDIHPINKKSFGELYNETMNREKIIKEYGYNLITKWESDE